MCVYVFIFIYSSIDGHLGCFHVLTNVNNGAVNMWVHKSCPVTGFVSFGLIPKSGIAGFYGGYIFNYHSLFTSSQTLLISCLLYTNHSHIHEMISHCGFGLHFPDDK